MGEIATLPSTGDAPDAQGQQRLFETVVHLRRTSLAPAGDPVVFDADTPKLGDRVRIKGSGYVSSVKFSDKDGTITERRTIVYDEISCILA